MTQTHICSGLGWLTPCQKREHCANYVHWSIDSRSQFNACSDSRTLRHFIQIGSPLPSAKPAPQSELFA